ncbi:hypothetical protein SUNI508_04335 [Seiridium unicorne]|uniref:Uncharacterized protein n=1 Tax=Seiridium unicorne TaxID=138068 RepID=A0ABR2V937_9PEZI
MLPASAVEAGVGGYKAIVTTARLMWVLKVTGPAKREGLGKYSLSAWVSHPSHHRAESGPQEKGLKIEQRFSSGLAAYVRCIKIKAALLNSDLDAMAAVEELQVLLQPQPDETMAHYWMVERAG